jgi:hypothetical protein
LIGDEPFSSMLCRLRYSKSISWESLRYYALSQLHVLDDLNTCTHPEEGSTGACDFTHLHANSEAPITHISAQTINLSRTNHLVTNWSQQILLTPDPELQAWCAP